MKADSSLLVLCKAEVPISYLCFQLNGSPDHSAGAMSMSTVLSQGLRFVIHPVCTTGLTLFADQLTVMTDVYREAFFD